MASVATTIAIIGQATVIARIVGVLFRGRSDVRSDLVALIIWTLARAAITATSDAATTLIARPVRRELRRRLLHSVTNRGVDAASDEIVHLATTGVDAIETYVATIVPSAVGGAFIPIVVLAWLTWRDYWSAGIAVACVVVLPLFMILLGLAARDQMDSRWREQARLANYVGDIARGMGDLKAYGREDEAVANIDEVGRAYTASTMATLRVAFLSGFALELLSSLAVALVALVLGLRLIAGHLNLTVAMAVLLVVPEVFVPLRRSASQYHASVAGMAAGEALLGLLSDDTPSGTLRAPLSPPSISFENVVVAADVRGRPTAPFSTSVAAGETLLLEGPSGAGKTTVLRTLLGRVPLREGHIRINGIDLADIDMSAWRRAIAYVPQEPRLVGDTVREALTYGADATSDDDLSRALLAVGLTVPLEHPLGEGSYTLSAGQRRRVALARALVSNPVVILLDEPLGHLDDDTAAEIREVLAHLPATVVVTSHRPLESAVTAQVRGAHR